MSCLSTLCIIIVLTIEHGYAAQSSALLTLYLTITALLDVAETRSFLRRPVAVHGVGALCATTALSKAVLLGLQEIPMQFGSELNKTIPRLAQEATAGFWNRTLLLWLNSTLCFGFRKNLRMQDLANLGNDFSSKNLAKKFQRRWNHGMLNIGYHSPFSSGNLLIKIKKQQTKNLNMHWQIPAFPFYGNILSLQLLLGSFILYSVS